MKNLLLFLTLFFITVSNAQNEKANINTSRSNIKNKVTVPVDTVQQKVDHNSVRSNKSTIKKDEEDTTDRSKTKQASQNNPYFKNNTLEGEMPTNQQKANINTSRSNTKSLAKPADSLNNSDASSKNAKKVRFKAGAELSDKVN
jgi:hypothetical protein